MKVDKVGVMKPQSHVKKAWKTPGYMSRLHDPHYESLEPQKPPHCLKVLAMIVEHSGGPHTYLSMVGHPNPFFSTNGVPAMDFELLTQLCFSPLR